MRVSLAVTALVLVPGCLGGPSAANVTLYELSSETAQVMCATAFACCSTRELDQLFPNSPNAATCEEHARAVLDRFASAVAEAESKGRIVYHGDRAAQCLNSVRNAACPDAARLLTVGLTATCESPFEALSEIDEPCTDARECKSGYCEGAIPEALVEGACRPIPLYGGDCLTACDRGLFCDFGDGNFTGICQPKYANGASCTANEQCMSASCVGAAGEVPGTCGTVLVCDGL